MHGCNPAIATLDNVVVPPGEICTMSAADVKGNVKVYGTLIVHPRTDIRGSIDAEPGHARVVLNGTGILVRGNVKIIGGTGQEGAGGYFDGTQIRGDFLWEENTTRLIADGGIIGGNVKAEKNTGGGVIQGNFIIGNLECKENDPVIVQFGNTIDGDDKCPE